MRAPLLASIVLLLVAGCSAAAPAQGQLPVTSRAPSLAGPSPVAAPARVASAPAVTPARLAPAAAARPATTPVVAAARPSAAVSTPSATAVAAIAGNGNATSSVTGPTAVPSPMASSAAGVTTDSNASENSILKVSLIIIGILIGLISLCGIGAFVHSKFVKKETHDDDDGAYPISKRLTATFNATFRSKRSSQIGPGSYKQFDPTSQKPQLAQLEIPKYAAYNTIGRPGGVGFVTTTTDRSRPLPQPSQYQSYSMAPRGSPGPFSPYVAQAYSAHSPPYSPGVLPTFPAASQPPSPHAASPRFAAQQSPPVLPGSQPPQTIYSSPYAGPYSSNSQHSIGVDYN